MFGDLAGLQTRRAGLSASAELFVPGISNIFKLSYIFILLLYVNETQA